jgi:hypothetical protein
MDARAEDASNFTFYCGVVGHGRFTILGAGLMAEAKS